MSENWTSLIGSVESNIFYKVYVYGEQILTHLVFINFEFHISNSTTSLIAIILLLEL